MAETREFYEWGYRTEDGFEMWGEDYGRDGTWIPASSDLDIKVVDLYFGSEERAIYRELDAAGVEGVAIRRLVTQTVGDVEDVPRPARSDAGHA